MKILNPPRLSVPWLIAYAVTWIVALGVQAVVALPYARRGTELYTPTRLALFPLGLPAFFAMIFGQREGFFLSIVDPSNYTILGWFIFIGHAAAFLWFDRLTIRIVLYVTLIVLLLFTLVGCNDLLHTESEIH